MALTSAGNIVVGVLALQGDFSEHEEALRKVIKTSPEFLHTTVKTVRNVNDLNEVDGLIIPGGESTTISTVMTTTGMLKPLRNFVSDKSKVTWGTCAGLILLASGLNPADAKVTQLGGLDVVAQRNAYGRQKESFVGSVITNFPGCPSSTESVFFIRAPVIYQITNPSVVKLATLNGNPVAIQQDNLLGTTFHPELTENNSWHKYFLQLVTLRAIKQ